MARTPDPAVRVALIEAAAQLLADDGIDALSIRRVAAMVGSSTMAVYTHFGSKDDLVQEVVREAFARLYADLSDVPVTDDPVADLVALGAAYRHNALANAPLYRVMFDRNPLSLGDPVTHDTGRGFGVGVAAFEALDDAVARCVAAGVITGDHRQLARQVWAAAHGAVSLELAGFLGDHGEATYLGATTAIFLTATTP